MKAVLTLKKMPEGCNECPLKVENCDGIGIAYNQVIFCTPIRDRIYILKDDGRPEFCPLAEMPERANECNNEYLTERDRQDMNHYNNGWNDALDAVEGRE